MLPNIKQVLLGLSVVAAVSCGDAPGDQTVTQDTVVEGPIHPSDQAVACRPSTLPPIQFSNPQTETPPSDGRGD